MLSPTDRGPRGESAAPLGKARRRGVLDELLELASRRGTSHDSPFEDHSPLRCLSHAEALLNAAAILGGQEAVRKTSRLLQEFAEPAECTRRMCRELDGLHRLLSLDCGSIPDSVEAACFAAIDPASPEVEEICLQTDGFRECLRALAREGHAFPSLERACAL